MAHRPTIMGTRHMVAACHYLASEAGFKILEAGGNAIDAGVATGIALSVVQPEYVNFAGVAPIIIYSAAEDRVVTIPGLGPWPKAIRPDRGWRKPKMVLSEVDLPAPFGPMIPVTLPRATPSVRPFRMSMPST